MNDINSSHSILEEFSSPEPADDFDFTGYKVLFAEDELISKDITIKLLKFVGLDVDWVSDGKTALDKFLSAPAGTYQAIIMDIMMPKMNGYDSAKAIRNSDLPDAQTIPIFALTSINFAKDLAESSHTEITEYFGKPLDSLRLYNCLKSYLNK